jgi:hypothetical protein
MQKKNDRPVRVETLTKQTWSMTPIMDNAYIKRWSSLSYLTVFLPSDITMPCVVSDARVPSMLYTGAVPLCLA